MNEKVRKLVTMAMLAALSIVLVYVIHFPIFPAASFLEYDPADIPILIGTFAYGPLAGVNSVVTFLVYKTVSRHLVHGENWKKEPGVKQAQPEQ